MTRSEMTVLYRGDKCSVVVVAGEEPSLLLHQAFAAEIWSLVMQAEKSALTQVANPKAEAILKLCASLEPVLARLGRESVEWEAEQPMPPDQKLATIELRNAMRELDKIQNNDGPDRA